MATRIPRRQLLALSIVAAISAATSLAAFAQDAPVSSAAATDAKPIDNKAKTTKLSEIKVTAQKRVEYLQDVPITMATLSKQQIHDAGVHTVQDLQMLIPDLTVTSDDSSANSSARIRGIGTLGDNAGLESAVGTVIDDVPRARTALGFGDLGPINQIDVLKGPQGTLFGKNTAAGVISVTTDRPTFTEQGYTDFTLGNYHASGVDAYYSNALSKNLAFSFYVVDRQHDGYEDVFVNNGPRTQTSDVDQNFHSLRGQLLIRPSNNVDINIIADYTKHNENCCDAVTLYRDPGVAQILDIFAGGPGRGVIPVADPSRRLAYANDSSGQKIVDEGVSAEVNWTTPWWNNAVLTSITAVRKYTLVGAGDLDFSGADLAEHDFAPDNGERFNTLSQELRLGGSTDRVDWTAGVYFDNDRIQRSESITENSQYEGYLSTALVEGIAAALPPGLINTANPQTFISQISGLPYGKTYSGIASQDQFNQGSKSQAAFGNATFHVTDAFSITGGLRYTHEEKTTDFVYHTPNGGLGCGAALTTNGVANALEARGVPGFVVPLIAPTVIGNLCLPWENPLFGGLKSSNKFTENEWSGTLKGAYRFDEHILTYVSGARGYNAGGYNLTRTQSSNGTTSGGAGIIPLTNTFFPGEFVNSYELGAKTTWADGNLLINGALFHSKFTNYQFNTFSGIGFVVDSIPRLTTQGLDTDLNWQTPITGLSFQGAATYTKARYGKELLADPVLVDLPGSVGSFAPKWTGTAGAAYQWNFNDRVYGRFAINAKYTSEYNASTTPNPLTEQKSFTLLDARLTIGQIGKHWTVELWGKNLTNRTYIQGAFSPALQTGSINGFLGDPRTYGVTLRAAL
jgi:iron complex outermembrane receptor protein